MIGKNRFNDFKLRLVSVCDILRVILRDDKVRGFWGSWGCYSLISYFVVLVGNL